MLHPDFPIVEGPYQLNDEWATTLPLQLNRRIEEGSLVLWRPGLTVWINIWGNDHNTPPQQRCERVRRDANPEAYDHEVIDHSDHVWFGYRLQEEVAQHSFYAFAFAPAGHVQAAFYFDDESSLEIVKQIWLSFRSSTVR